MSRLSIVRIHCQYKCQKGGNFPKLSIIVGVVTGVSDVSDVFVFVFVFVCHCHCQVTKIFRNSVSQFPELLWVSQMPQVSEIVFVFVFVRKVKSLSKCIFQIVFVKLYLSKCIFSCLSISLIKCLKGQKCLGLLFNVKNQKWLSDQSVSEWVSEWVSQWVTRSPIELSVDS